MITAKPMRGVTTQQAIVDVERVLRREHHLPPGKDNDFTIQDPRQFLEVQQADRANIFAILLASIASVSLVVGGIGIMNIMLVSVTERTREIGIRKALGATRWSILIQFIVEAMILCLLGGAVGVLLGMGVAKLLSRGVRLAGNRVARFDRHGLRIQRGGRAFLRYLAGAQGGAPRSDRGAALRIARCGSGFSRETQCSGLKPLPPPPTRARRDWLRWRA